MHNKGVYAWFVTWVIAFMVTPLWANTWEGEFIWLLVDKVKLDASLQTIPPFPEQADLLRNFRIAIGKEKGDKLREGDNRTPEGIYFTLPHVPEEKLRREKYGSVAIPLNFPNPFDQFEKKTGHGIWLHGAGNDERMAEENVTEGCVAFFNSDIIKLKSWLNPYQGIVVITNDATSVNRSEDQQAVQKLAEQWIADWRKRDLNGYINAYSPDFVSGGRTKDAYRIYKQSVFRSYRNMSINITDLRTITHPKYAVVMMNQDFQGDQRFRSRGRKVLYWRKEGDQWKILQEAFGSISFEKQTFSRKEREALNPILTLSP